MGSARTISITLLPLLLWGFLQTPLGAQSAFDSVYYGDALRITERLEVFTDRSLYVVNEPVRFRVDRILTGIQEMPWSDVLYMELLAPDGKAVARAKYSITDHVSKGDMLIPADVASGIYYLKCYTRWMRNRGPSSFRYLPLKVVNPFRQEVAGSVNGDRGTASLDREPYLEGVLEIGSPEQPFGINEEVRFRLSAPGGRYLENLQCCVTIVPAGAIDTLNRSFTGSRDGSETSRFSLEFLPDLGGASIGGRVVQEDGSPGGYATLHFTLFGSDPGYYVTTADERGRFILSTLGAIGASEVFVEARPYREEQVEVRIDQDFDQTGIPLPGEPFSLTDRETELATTMAVRMQLLSVFGEEELPAFEENPLPGPDTVPFYGKPVFQLELDEFVDLPYLDEVFENLVPTVSFIRRQGKRQFLVGSENNTVALYAPLVMVDYIPVFDHDAVLSLPTEKIKSIGVINEVYIRGNVAFGGVISILSRQGDMAGIDLPDGSYFFDFQALEPLEEGTQLQVAPAERSERYPDTRNTLLWLDNVVLRQGAPVEISCTMPDQPGEYVILVRTMLPGEEVHAVTSRFRVE